MTLLNDLPQTRLQFYLTSPYPCSYLPEQTACSQVVTPAHLVDSQAYSELIRAGFRRSGLFTYRPQCGHCQACTPVRVAVDGFHPNRTQRRTGSRNAGLIATPHTPHFDTRHFDLYRRYQSARHPGGGMDHDDREQYTHFLVQSNVDTYLVAFHEAGELRMVSLIDQVYTFYDPDLPQRSLGVYNVLWQIELARSLGLPFVYLGYWIAGSRKMAYKSQYQPLQGLIDAEWRPFSAT
jgi:arginyl-tRNA--protein-N-Asp/Glu arginylyltransferase